MLEELCKELNNWDFQKRAKKYFSDDFTIADGNIQGMDDKLTEGQYFRIVGSLFNDGIYSYPATNLKDEVFDGAVWAMAIPDEVIALADEIEAWVAKYGSTESPNMSPYQSESFGGYSYSKGSGGSDGTSAVTWKDAFDSKLSRWRKI